VARHDGEQNENKCKVFVRTSNICSAPPTPLAWGVPLRWGSRLCYSAFGLGRAPKSIAIGVRLS